MLSITRVPKPWRVGGLPGGPPVSIQRRTRRPSDARDQSTERVLQLRTGPRTWPRWSQARAGQPQVPEQRPAASRREVPSGFGPPWLASGIVSARRQRLAIERFAKAARYAVVDWFHDPAVSGADPKRLMPEQRQAKSCR
jgi:hypothetical protein